MTGRARRGASLDHGAKVLYVCKAVDETHPVLANQARWIATLAHHPRIDHVEVLTSKRGRATLPANVTVRDFGGPPPLQIPRAMARFSWYLATARTRFDWCFVTQGGPAPALLLPWKVLTRRPVYHWKAMPHVSRRMRFYARWCDDLVFTATPSSLPLDLPNVRVVGHGIDTDLFAPRPGVPGRDLVALTRVARVKRLERVVRAVAECREHFGADYTLDIVGPCDSKSQDYRRELLELVTSLDLDGSVRFLGSVEHADVPGLVGGYRAAVNVSETAFDKAAGEVMACELPLLSGNRCDLEVLPDDLAAVLRLPEEDDAAARVIHEALSWDDATRTAVGRRLRATVVEHHSLAALFDKIMDAIDAHAGTGKHRRQGSPPPRRTRA